MSTGDWWGIAALVGIVLLFVLIAWFVIATDRPQVAASRCPRHGDGSGGKRGYCGKCLHEHHRAFFGLDREA